MNSCHILLIKFERYFFALKFFHFLFPKIKKVCYNGVDVLKNEFTVEFRGCYSYGVGWISGFGD